MSLKTRLRENLLTGTIGAALTVICGAFFWWFQIGEGLIHLSYDLPVVFGSPVVPAEVIIVRRDEASNRVFTNDIAGLWDRKIHAKLLDKLRSDQSLMAVFDFVFADAGTPESNAEFARAIKAHGNVLLAAGIDPISHPGSLGETITGPRQEFRDVAQGWGVTGVDRDKDLVVRKHYLGTESYPSLAWAAAVQAKPALTNHLINPEAERWMRYYGTNGTIPSISYHMALEAAPGYFKDKIVFVGGKSRTLALDEVTDLFRTPYTRWDGELMPGVEINATTYLNLLRDEWLTRLSLGTEFVLLLSGGLLLGFGLTSVRPLAAAGLGLSAVLAIAALAMWLFWQQRIWFSWMVIAGAQIPCAFLWSVLAYTISLYREKEEVEKELATSRDALEAVRASAPTLVIQQPGGTPAIANYALVRCVGEGAFGQVWLARNAIGIFHAVKIVSRHSFEDAGPYEREFRGIQKYMPISLNHPSLVPILHVGRNDEAGYFYSIMEAADDEVGGQKIDPDTYSPRTLSKDLQKREKLPIAECLSLGLALTTALEFLHQQQLIHRDIKPSNIIFINGVPKLADIGLVTEIRRKGKEITQVGTKWYMAPEGPGTPAADLYSLGKVIYVASTGKGANEFPSLPTQLDERTDQVELIQLNQIILKACEEKPYRRYQSAAEMHAHLLRLQSRLPP